MNKKMLLFIATGFIALTLQAQETLQTVTERGDTTNRNISIYGKGANYFRGATTVDSAWRFNQGFTTYGAIWNYTGFRSDSYGPIASANSTMITFVRPFHINSSTAMQMKGTTAAAGSIAQAGIDVTDSLTWNANTHANGWSQIRLSPVLNQTGFTGITRGVYVNPALTSVTNFRGIEVKVDSAKGYQFFAAGTGPSCFAGNIGIGVAAPQEKLHVNGNILTTQKFYVGSLYRTIGDMLMTDNQSHVMAFRNTSGTGNPLGGFDFGDIGNASWMRIVAGNVGIGTTSPTQKLAVNGTILAKRVKVSTAASDWPDYVFDSSYLLQPLPQVELFIQAQKHLPGIPSAADVEKEGIDVAQTQAAMLKKIEELTLYVIEQNKKLETQNQKMQEQEKRILLLEKNSRK